MSERVENSKIVTGLIKWFDPAKGYGFVVNNDGGADILLHANVLRNFGQGSVADRARVRVRVVPTDRGLQASEVLEVLPPDTHGQPPLTDLDHSLFEQMNSLPLRPARVKWFDKHKGFGFANIFGHADDMFLHIEVLRHSGLADLAPGEAIAVRVVEGPRGLIAAQIRAWDSAVQGSDSLSLSLDRDDDGFQDPSLMACVAE